MSIRLSTLVVAMGLSLLPPLMARADEAADKKAEIQRKKEEAKKRALDKAAAEKAAAEKAAAEKAAAEKAAADKAKTGGGGASGTGGASGKGNSGGAGGKGNSGGAGGKGNSGAGGAAATKVAEKDAKAAEKEAPLPAGDREALRKDRPERRSSSVERLRKRWGRVLASDKGIADLKLHARRVALLQRVRVIAEAKKDTKSVELVDQLLTAEDERHSTAMNALREGALK